MRLIGDEAGAFDIAQETFLYLLRQLPASPGDEPFVLRAASLKSYLYPVIRNLAVTGGRQRTRCVAHGERVARHADLVRQNVIRDEPPDVAKLHERIDALPRGQREAVLLRFGDGLAIQEIATALGIPTGTVKSRLHHALRTLRDDPELRKFLPDR